MKTPKVHPKTVLVTGCSSGIGLATAKLLRNRGWQVVPTARKPEDLDMLRRDEFAPVRLDVTDSASIADASAEVMNRFNGQLGALVNNAGFGITAAMEDCSRDMLRAVFEVNLFGMQELTNRFVPVFRKQGYGRIVNVSSVLGELSLPFAGAYSASKFAVEAASDALRRELFDSGVAVSIIQPGPIDSRFSKNLAHRTDEFAGNPTSPFLSFYKEAIETRKNGTAGRTAEGFMKPPEAVAEAVFQCLEKSRPPIRVRVTAPAHFGAFARRFLPAALIDAVAVSKLRKKLQNRT
ncbi:SDR family NAD(P)-dependent oxidoreductase [Tichowtungia aerotolerans]|uniref:SDR family NAD(P)-dependent oxidoreductase n=1 Tax=Tichowtungia aerotolerans TaxID=2697043 RepID=A0A6P1M713_9BACT|nr:SDR family NAD(P)-dependent oxidoreductase [Tichowtungia aerotolerans]QHI69647.1 SDR family NAD(P)-dependent oxidoreductase [Tichowtungia aerotolerans]